MGRRRFVIPFLVIALLNLGLGSMNASGADASQVRPSQAASSSALSASLNNLTQRSDLIVVGTVKGSTSYWNAEHTLIYTDTTVSVESTVKGTTQPSEVKLTTMGGQVGDIKLAPPELPSFQTGEKDVLFLKQTQDSSYATIDGTKGKYAVENDSVGEYSLPQFVAQVRQSMTAQGMALPTSSPMAEEPTRIALPDNATVIATPQPSVTPLTTGWSTVMSDNLESGFPGTKWALYGNPTWGTSTYKPHTASYSVWCAKGGTNGLDPATSNYANSMNAWMVYGPFSLSDASDAQLDFYWWLDSEYGVDKFKIGASLDGTNFAAYSTSGSTGGWTEDSFDLKAFGSLGNLTGHSQVWIAFIFTSDSANTGKGAFLDDISLTKYVGTRPIISNITPGSASAGTNAQVTITGTGFGATQGAGNVTFYYQYGQPRIVAPVVSWSDTSIVVKVPVDTINSYPASASSGPVIVTNGSGGASDGYQFAVTFSYLGTKWAGSHPQVHYRINANAPGITGEDTAFRAAAQTWTDVPAADFDYVYDGTTTATQGGLDGVNEILWRDLGTQYQGVIAWAMPWINANTNTYVEYDIEFNIYYTWSTTGASGTMDVQNIGTHELGHVTGLRDLYGDVGTPNDMAKTMFGFGSFAETQKRTLEPGDIAGLQWMYPPAQPPTVAVTYPNGGETVAGQVTVSANATPGTSPIANVAFAYSSNNGTNWSGIASDTSYPYTVSWNTTPLADGSLYLIRAVATDSNNLTAMDVSDATFTVRNNQPPTVAVTYPNGGETVAGQVTVSANATAGSSPTTQVAFAYSSNNGTNWSGIASDTSSPYTVSWNTTPLSNGNQYLIRATATDSNNSTSMDVSDSTFTVQNNQPPIVSVTYPNGGELLRGTVNVTADASDADGSVTQVNFAFSSDNGSTWHAVDSDNASPYSVPWNTATVTDGTHYLVRATASDNASGTASDTSNAEFTVDNTPPPAPSLLSPQKGSLITNNHPTLTWSSVSDATGVTYEVQVDDDPAFGSLFENAAGLTSGNYTLSAAAPQGTYNWRVRASDGAGNASAWTPSSSFTVVPAGGIWWAASLVATAGTVSGNSTVGVALDASAGFDSYDVPKGATPSEPFVSVYIPHSDWTTNSGNYTQDIRPQAGYLTWTFDVLSSSSDNVTLRWNSAQIPQMYQSVSLIDGATGDVLVGFMRSTSQCVYLAQANVSHEFKLMVQSTVTTLSRGWNMFSIPADLSSAGGGDFTDSAILGDEYPGGSGLYIYWYNPAVGGYSMWTSTSKVFTAAPGQGYWLKTSVNQSVDVSGAPVPDRDFVIHLTRGWNQIGQPFNYPVNWGDVKVSYNGTTVGIEQATDWVTKYLYRYDTATGGYVMDTAPAGQLAPWRGYWVKALVAADLIIPKAP